MWKLLLHFCCKNYFIWKSFLGRTTKSFTVLSITKDPQVSYRSSCPFHHRNNNPDLLLSNSACKQCLPDYIHWAPSAGTKGNWHTTETQDIPSEYDRAFHCEGTEHWHRLPSEVESSPPWRYSKDVWRQSWATDCKWPC